MEKNRFLKDLWTILVVNQQAKVVEVIASHETLFFGKRVALGDDIATICTDESSVIDAINRAFTEQRNIFFSYTSSNASSCDVQVVAHAIYTNEELVTLYAMEVAAEDLRREALKTSSFVIPATEALLRPIMDSLPMGLELYDSDGRLIDINAVEMKTMGISSKEDVLGVDLFLNPNLPEEAKASLLAGQDVRFSLNYDFDRAGKDYFKTSMSDKWNIDVTISVLRDQFGAVDKYLILTQDVTEKISLQQNYELLYNQNQTVLDSLPIGVELYAIDGTLVYLNNMDCRIFGVDRETILGARINVFDNPNFPNELKEAVRKQEKLRMRFPYHFSIVSQQGYYVTKKEQDIVLQIEYSGQPVYNSDGTVASYIFIVEDVTEKVLTEKLLRRSKHKIEQILTVADIMLWEFDACEGVFYSENEKLNQYDPTRPISIREYMDSIHPDDQLRAYENIQNMSAGKDWSHSFDLKMKFPEIAEWQYCHISGTPYERDEQGKVIRYVGFRKNNTQIEKKRILQENILNSIPLPVHIKDPENDFRYVFCNDESKKMFGTDESRTSYDIMNDEYGRKMQENDREVFATGEPYLGEERIVLKDGRSYDTIVQKSIIYDGDKRLLLTARWDESLQNDLKRRAKVLSISMQTINAYTWFYEPATDLLSFGDGFEKEGRDESRVNSMSKFARHVHPDDRDRFAREIDEVLQKDSCEFSIEARVDLTGEDTHYEWWECRGIVETSVRSEIPYKYMYGMDVNIESHKQVELTLLENKNRLDRLIRQNELVLNNINSGLAYVGNDYIVQWENISVCSKSLSLHAYKQGEYCYKSTHNRSTPCENCILERARISREIEQTTFKIGKRTVEVFATPVINPEGGTFDGIVIRMDDVTDRQAIFEELKRAKAKAEESDKLKSAFLANMSHEIRTPLNAIVGFSDLLIHADDPQEREDYQQIINSNNELLLKLINDILDLSKIEAGSVELKYEKFDLAEHFNGLASSMKQRVSNPNVQLINLNPYISCVVQQDKNRITQIITNYVTNAIKYTPEGTIEMAYEKIPQGIRLYVKDTGLGIPDEKKNRVFHRFEKLDEFAQGTGLGLSICKAIAESMGGSVGFESDYGKGSTFWAELPCKIEALVKEGASTQETISSVQASDPVSKDIADRRKTILIAEDIHSNYLLVSSLLRKEYDLVHAVNGQEAIDLLNKHRIDLLLMDMKMPVMDGMTATLEIRKLNKTIPIIALTAHAFDSDRESAMAIGCNEYLVKPINRKQLEEVLHRYLG